MTWRQLRTRSSCTSAWSFTASLGQLNMWRRGVATNTGDMKSQVGSSQGLSRNQTYIWNGHLYIYIDLYIGYACLCHSKQIQYLQEIRFTMDDDWLQIPCFREQICFVLAKFKQLEDLEGYAPWVYLQLLVLVYLYFVCLSRLLIENVQDLAPYWVADKYSLPQHVSGRIQYRAPGRDHGRQNGELCLVWNISRLQFFSSPCTHWRVPNSVVIPSGKLT